MSKHLGVSSRSRGRWLGPVTWLLLVIAVIWLGYEGWRLLFQSTPPDGLPAQGPGGAVDLSLRYIEVNGWFGGEPIYQMNSNAVYPPASYLILWPFLGWLSFGAARWLWGLVVVVTLVPLLRNFVKSCGELPPAERRFLLLVPLATYPVGATVGNGQVGIMVLLCLLYCLPLLRTCASSWRRDTLIAAVFLIALVKPTLAAPFFWIVLFSAGGLRPAIMIAIGYLGLTVLSAIPQHASWSELLRAWLSQGMEGARWGAKLGEGSIRIASDAANGEGVVQITGINLHCVLGFMGYGHMNMIASLSAVIGVGIWVFVDRHRPIWLLLAVVAIVTRFYTYHGWYDDVLLLLPMVALARLAGGLDGASGLMCRIASGLFLAMLLFLLAPGGGYLLGYPWNNIYLVAQSLLWLGVLLFLAWGARCAPTSAAQFRAAS